ncbi:MAG: DNA topoisomerase 3 [Thermoanaerobaculia bacterium]|nr:DNA topoisomerase 3 [Thermoanaerobaculia bacterium]
MTQQRSGKKRPDVSSAPLEEPSTGSSSVVVVAEKPSVARDLARVLGAARRGEGCFQGKGYTVTWAIGHLVALAMPHQIRPEWQRWSKESLPIIPETWPLVIQEETRPQFEVIKRLLTAKDTSEVICATDAGREGELIFRYIYEAAQSHKPVKRLWISSLTDDAIRKGFSELKAGKEFDPLADAARGRSRADWLVGMNLSRACTLAFGEDFSVGRVQTPTLALLADRELAIKAFVPEDYLEIEATFSSRAGELAEGYRGTYFQGPEPTAESKRLQAKGPQAAEARQIAERAKTGKARIDSVSSETQKQAPPLFYDLTELQRHANRLYGYTAKRTLEIAQALYEQKKLISYPRTDSRHVSEDVAATLGAIVSVIRTPFEKHLAPGTGERPLGKRFVDDAKVSDHHAILPTTVPAHSVTLDRDEEAIYGLVCRRLLAAWQPDHITSTTSVITAVSAPDGGPVDRYHSTGTMVVAAGWKALDPVEKTKKDDDKGEEQVLPPGLSPGSLRFVHEAGIREKRTRPPRRFTEASLLTAMETAGKTLDDKALSDAMRDSGLGTPATRAEIIENLIKRLYVERKGKSLSATPKGISLIEKVHPEVKSPALTGDWELRLKRIQEKKASLGDFMNGIEAFVKKVLGEMFGSPSTSGQRRPLPPPSNGPLPPPPMVATARNETPEGPRSARTVVSGQDLGTLLRDRFRLPSFRPHQEAVCRAVTAGKDVLLVMPTGAGKSLCYQLPGIARGGTTLVISPLIALMEDQVAKLQEQGFVAERIHSGRDRLSSRKVCFDYLEGTLDFLYIAPERLSVPGFPEMLAKRPPVLVAVDEAHCISQWGHDFRPDYRMLNRWLPSLRPAPVIALTATATPRVQDDIAEQLGLVRPIRSIRGFRRDNIGIEITRMARSARPEAVATLLRDPARRPAIIYAPSRKEADALAVELRPSFSAAAYHAGMTAPERDRVQNAFLSGQLEVIVATIAFGMGVDKPDVRTVIHTGLSGSVEGYYQEIGRAGRDGKPSRAVLLYSWADRKLHEFFHERDYPDVLVLQQIWSALGTRGASLDELRESVQLDPEVFEKALEKLVLHGGAAVHGGEAVKGGASWKPSYLLQKSEKLEKLEQMCRLAEAHACRMSLVMRHFGDDEDAERPCGQCDVCTPQSCLVTAFARPRREESEISQKILESLRRRDRQGSGQLYRDTCSETAERKAFERVLRSLARAGLVDVREDSFQKDGETIVFHRVTLTPAGYRANPQVSILIERDEEERPRKRTRNARKKK